MTRTSVLGALIASVLVPVLAGPVLAVGHYELAWFRMWDISENAGCAGINILEVWVFNENGQRMGSVAIRDEFGNCIPGQSGTPICYATGAPPESKQAQIGLWPTMDPLRVKCVDGGGSTSDLTPPVTTQFLPCYGHYSYEAGFIFKANASTPGEADDTLIGELPEAGDDVGDYSAAHTASMVYASQDYTQYSTADAWQLSGLSGGGERHSQTFVATGINRITTVFGFPVQPGNGSTVWRASIQVGGPDGPTICETTSPFDLYFGNPLAFDVDECPVTPGETYAYTMEPLQPSDSNVYTYPNDNYPDGEYYHNGQIINANWDMFGFVAGWDAGADAVGYIAGRVEDTNGDPLVDALVTLKDAGGTTVIAQDNADHTGSYAFKTVAPGTYTVLADLAGFEPGNQGGVVVTAAHYTIVNFTLAPQLQELTNDGFEIGNLHAWVAYGGVLPYVWPESVMDFDAASGDYFMGIASSTTTGGVYQRVPSLNGESYEAAFQMLRRSGTFNARIGVDPNGGTDPAAGSVVWSNWSTTPVGTWSTGGDPDKIVGFTATGPYATVFLQCEPTGDGGFVAFDNVRLFRTTGPNYSQQRTFDTGWNLVSAPLLSGGAGDPVPSVFDEVIAAGNSLEGNLHRYNAGSAAYETYSGAFTNATQGRGYWMNLWAGTSETISGPLPLDPISQALSVGWSLIGQPHRYGTPLASLIFRSDDTIEAWHDNVTDKCKYRSDGPWSWVNNAETVIEWGLYVVKHGYTDGYPRIKFREDAEVLFTYDENNGWWSLPGTRTAGGVNVGTGYRVLMAPDSWHTVRAYHNGASLTWAITVDGLTDAAHRAEGTFSAGSSGSGYVQFGVVSSPKRADFYTSHVYWGQNAEIDNWPASKKYDASANETGPEIAYGSFLGWGKEISGTERSYSAAGSVEKTFDEAVAAGWVEGSAVGYDDGYTIVRPAGGDDTSIRAWYGYWLKVNEAGLTVKMPGPAEATEGASDISSLARLSLDADGCITSNFVVGLSPTADDGYETTEDVAVPPAGPAGQKEVAMGTTLSSEPVLMDVREEPAPAGTKVWSCTVQPVGFGAGECKTVTITWDVSAAGEYDYKLVDVSGGNVETMMTAGGQYTFQICQGQTLTFEVRAGDFEEVQVLGWSSVRNHGPAGDLAITLDASASGTAVITETRREGLQKVLVDINADVSGSISGTIEADDLTHGGSVAATAQYTINGGTTLVIEFMFTNPTPPPSVLGLPDKTCYSIDLAGHVAGLTGDTDCKVRVLAGDINGSAPPYGDGKVDLTDMAKAKANAVSGTPLTEGTCLFDVNIDGSINLTDMALIKSLSLVGGTASCP